MVLSIGSRLFVILSNFSGICRIVRIIFWVWSVFSEWFMIIVIIPSLGWISLILLPAKLC